MEKFPNQDPTSKETNEAHLEKERELREDNFREPVPVEALIPGIKEATLTKDEQLDWRDRAGDRALENDFWRWEIERLINRGAFKEHIIEERKDGSIIFDNDIHDIFELPVIIKTKNEEHAKALKLFQGQVVVDLGAGLTPSGYQLSELLKAEAYVGVEPFNHGQLKSSLKRLESRAEDARGNDSYHNSPVIGYWSESFFASLPGFSEYRIPYSVVAGDMLSFLQRLPDNSVSVMMGGIDRCVIGDQEYRDQVMREIERVLDPKGGFLSESSFPEPSEILETAYTDGSGEMNDGRFVDGANYIFRKKE